MENFEINFWEKEKYDYLKEAEDFVSSTEEFMYSDRFEDCSLFNEKGASLFNDDIKVFKEPIEGLKDLKHRYWSNLEDEHEDSFINLSDKVSELLAEDLNLNLQKRYRSNYIDTLSKLMELDDVKEPLEKKELPLSRKCEGLKIDAPVQIEPLNLESFTKLQVTKDQQTLTYQR